ncbi:Vmc-like lipoprotein signal peptide domain-containing protein [Ureaplasma canigenitalium]|uniref:Vmc-like lipoprotein signal peptide domain-containing protein n=1 Tax=Ureaplasma canigenitalium TaxID=42092 RepID=UPI00068B3649|nr:hypothetical protein [Ureaplasma canigenitalium]
MKLKNNKRKILIFSLLSLTLGATVTSVAVACNNENRKGSDSGHTLGHSKIRYKIMPTYSSQADNLIALGITPDYYPHQLYWKGNKPFPYLDATSNSQIFQRSIYKKPDFRKKLGDKLTSLFDKVQTYDSTWWSFSGNEFGENLNEEFWDKHKGGLVFYDRYLLDNSHFIPNKDRKLTPENGPIADGSTVVSVDFKLSRDLYLSLSKHEIENLENANANDNLTTELRKSLQYLDDDTKSLHPLHNYGYFAQKLNKEFLHGETFDGINFANSNFAKRVLDSNDIPLFYAEKNWNTKSSLNNKIWYILKQLILSDEIKKGGLDHLNYHPSNLIVPNGVVQKLSHSTLHHHPIFEQNLRRDGGTQLYLGSMRDFSLYLYEIAYNTTKYSHTEKAAEAFKSEPERLQKMKDALKNANEIVGNYIDRLKNMRDLFKLIGYVDKNYDPDTKNFDNTNSKTLSLLTLSTTDGSSTVQSQSKYGFLYYDLGFKAPAPKLKSNDPEALLEKIKGDIELCHTHPDGSLHCPEGYDAKLLEKITGSIFNMDDNGWWWNLGEKELKSENFNYFSGSTDLMIQVDYSKAGKEFSSINNTIVKSLLKKDTNHEILRDNFEIWNDGVKNPIGINQALDSVLKLVLNHFESVKTKFFDDQTKNLNGTEKEAFKKKLEDQIEAAKSKAISWGSYWDRFVESN